MRRRIIKRVFLKRVIANLAHRTKPGCRLPAVIVAGTAMLKIGKKFTPEQVMQSLYHFMREQADGQDPDGHVWIPDSEITGNKMAGLYRVPMNERGKMIWEAYHSRRIEQERSRASVQVGYVGHGKSEGLITTIEQRRILSSGDPELPALPPATGTTLKLDE